MNTKVLEYEFQPETVAVVALDDTGRLLIPQVVTYTSIGGHDLGAVCNVVAGSLLCSVWDLCVYQVPSIALDTEVYRAVYGYKIPMDTPYVYAHYLNLPELKYKLMIEYKKVMDNLEDPYHLTY